MPNIRESLYQCLLNEVSATKIIDNGHLTNKASAKIKLCEAADNAYAITIYVVYNGTSFLEINLNSGKIKRSSNENPVGYYRIRQAALQEDDELELHLINHAYYLTIKYAYANSANTNTALEPIKIRKEIKFGVFNELLSAVSDADLTSSSLLTSIKYDQYRQNTAYSNGYFVESNEYTYVKQLAVRGGEDGILGENDQPFKRSYIETVTTSSIINPIKYSEATDQPTTQEEMNAGSYFILLNGEYVSAAESTFDSNTTYYVVDSSNNNTRDRIKIGTSGDPIEIIHADTVSSTSIENTGTANIGSHIKFNGNESYSTIGGGEYSSDYTGFTKEGYLEIRQHVIDGRTTDSDHVYTKYQTVYDIVILTSDNFEEGKYYVFNEQQNSYELANGSYSSETTYYEKHIKQMLVVPGGISMTGPGDFDTVRTDRIFVSDTGGTLENNTDYAVYIRNKKIQAKSLLFSNADKTKDNDTLQFVTSISQDTDGKVKYHYADVNVDNTYIETSEKPITGKGVKDAFDTLDALFNTESGNNSNSNIRLATNKTLVELKEDNGIVSAKVNDIEIGISQIAYNYNDSAAGEFPSDITWHNADEYINTTGTKNTRLTSILADRARLYHGHGLITPDGKIRGNGTTVTFSTNAQDSKPALLFLDKDGNINYLSATFDNNANTGHTFLNRQGQWVYIYPEEINGAPAYHAAALDENIYGVGTESLCGHVKLLSGDLKSVVNHVDGIAASAAHTHSQYAPVDHSAGPYNYPYGRAEVVNGSNVDSAKLGHVRLHGGDLSTFPGENDGEAASAYHNHNSTYVMHWAEQDLDETHKSTARSNIGAGTMSTFNIVTDTGRLALSGGTISTNGTTKTSSVSDAKSITLDLAQINSSDGSFNCVNSDYGITYDSSSGKYKMKVAKITYDKYGRVDAVQSEIIELNGLTGRTASYDFDSTTGTLTINAF